MRKERKKKKLLDGLSKYQNYQTRTKVIIRIFALACTEQHMPGKIWGQCCKEANRKAHKIGLSMVKNLQMVELWCQNFHLLHNFTIGSLPGKHNLPPFLQENRDVSLKIQAYARENKIYTSYPLS
jgi:hypothetical protein